MKIYVSVDMEGIAGVLLPEQLKKGERAYEEARKLLTAEVNVVIEALIEAGADDIYVKDAHGTGYNFIASELHHGARYCMGATNVSNRFPGLDSSFDGAMLIGYHAMGGTEFAIRDHTMTSVGWQSIHLNGRPIGEIGIDSLIFGLHNVPVLFVTGDKKTCEEASKEIPNVRTYETKEGLGRHAALVKPPKLVYRELKEMIKESIDHRENVLPVTLDGPYELVMKFFSTDQVDQRYFDGMRCKRIDGLTAAYSCDNILEVLSLAF
ncbi:aminopeptidase [Bacillus sp. HNG]|uniref:M55 family metallopeptidase n=1 Tax=Bacillus sp. HNG TaxID=2293325 RepID=UPI000E2FD873|nr:M55 family metallopeptidase [Bacillus sp. HNG]RFB19281.1 aminopeptidase [Bacillus sp. HNG]